MKAGPPRLQQPVSLLAGSAFSRKQGARCRTLPTEPGDPQSWRAGPRLSRSPDALRARKGWLCADQELIFEAPALRHSEKSPEIVAVDPGVAQDPSERAALEFTMKRDHQRNRALVVFQTHMATAQANGNPSDLLQSVDQLLAEENRQPRSRGQRQRTPKALGAAVLSPLASPSSSLALSLKPRVAYLALNFDAL
jgi:hypothetical protein